MNQASGTTSNVTGLPTGTMPRPGNPPLSLPLNLDFPPPPLQQRKQDLGKNSEAYAGIIKGLIRESNDKYRTDLEQRIETRIQNSLNDGFAKMLREIRKLNTSEKSLQEIESTTSEEGAKGPNDITGAPRKNKNKGQDDFPPNPQRRLDFQNSHSNNSSNFSINMSPANRADPEVETPRNEIVYQERRYPYRGPIRVDKWDISFDGNPEHVYIEDFIFRIEYLQKQHSCPWEDLKGEFHKLLKGDAKDWYWMMVQYREIQTWDDLKKALRIQYGSNRSEYEVMRDLEERRQKPGESIDFYFQVMKKLQSRLRTPLPEYEVIRIIKRNLRKDISQILYPMTLFTVEQLRDECKEVEKIYLRKEYTQTTAPSRLSNPRRHVDEVFENKSEEEDCQLVEEVKYPRNNIKSNVPQGNTNNIICWNCRSPGHLFMDCTSIQRNIFCYRCGKFGEMTPTCPKCSGNTSRSVAKTAESRSTQTTAESQTI